MAEWQRPAPKQHGSSNRQACEPVESWEGQEEIERAGRVVVLETGVQRGVVVPERCVGCLAKSKAL